MSLPAHQQSVKRYIAKAMEDLPALPNAVTRVLEATQSDTSTAKEIEELVSSDVALASKLLRVVNSPYFGLSGRVGNVSQAIVILGYVQVRNIVLSVSALSVFKAQNPRLRETQRAIWEHAFGAASAAQLISRHKNLELRDAETAFVGGLLHDVGKLFFLSSFTSTYLELLKSANEQNLNLSELEVQSLGIDHAELGKELAVVWRFPDTLAFLIGNHEGPFLGAPIDTVYCVHAADRLSTRALGPANSTDREAMDPQVERWLELDEAKTEAFMEEVRTRVEAASELLGLL